MPFSSLDEDMKEGIVSKFGQLNKKACTEDTIYDYVKDHYQEDIPNIRYVITMAIWVIEFSKGDYKK
jgi:hypothetical protein